MGVGENCLELQGVGGNSYEVLGKVMRKDGRSWEELGSRSRQRPGTFPKDGEHTSSSHLCPHGKVNSESLRPKAWKMAAARAANLESRLRIRSA